MGKLQIKTGENIWEEINNFDDLTIANKSLKDDVIIKIEEIPRADGATTIKIENNTDYSIMQAEDLTLDFSDLVKAHGFISFKTGEVGLTIKENSNLVGDNSIIEGDLSN